MHPAPSVILFTVLSGAGFGLLFFLGLGLPAPTGLTAFLHWGLGYGLAVSGLVASTFHLGNPQRTLLAFTQWRSSWLSREAWAAVLALLTLAPVALSDWLGLGWPRGLGFVGAAFCGGAVLATAMIYAQIRAVPRWNHWTTPTLFLCYGATGGALLAGQVGPALLSSVALIVALLLAFRFGDRAFALAGQTLGTATGLDRIGAASVFEQPHTGGNYLMREMIHVVGRKHASKLRWIALGLAALPAALLVVLPGSSISFGLISFGPISFGLAASLYLIGAMAARWLFFAEAEHVVGLYYGQR